MTLAALAKEAKVLSDQSLNANTNILYLEKDPQDSKYKDLFKQTYTPQELQAFKSVYLMNYTDDQVHEINTPSNIKYYATESVATEYTLDDDTFTTMILGAVGSGKTTASIFKIMRVAHHYAICKDNTIRTKILICRGSYNDLKNTVIPSIKEILGDDINISLHSMDGSFKTSIKNKSTGEVIKIDMQIVFLSFGDIVRANNSLLSLEISHCFVSEAKTINEEVMNAASRCGRYPPATKIREDQKANNKPQIFLDTNAYSKQSWCFKTFNENKSEQIKLYIQPPAVIKNPEYNPRNRSKSSAVKYIINSAAENIAHLYESYYPNLIATRSNRWQDVYLAIEFKDLFESGLAVFEGFDEVTHVIDEKDIPPLHQNQALYIGADQGRNGAIVIATLMDGVLVIIDEIVVHNYSSTLLARDLKQFMEEYYKYNDYEIYIDSAAASRGAGLIASDESQYTIWSAVFSNKIKLVSESLNPQKCIESVHLRLDQRTQVGLPKLLVSSKCTRSIAAMAGGHSYKRISDTSSSEAKYSLQVNKNSGHADLGDAISYLCVSMPDTRKDLFHKNQSPNFTKYINEFNKGDQSA